VVDSSIVQNKGTIDADAQKFGLRATIGSFEAGVVSLSPLGKDAALEYTQKSYFNPLFAQATNNKVSVSPAEEAYAVIGANGIADVYRVMEYGNNRILKGSDMAKFGVTEDGFGNKNFFVESPFTEEQNSKLIGMLDSLMSKHTTQNASTTFPVWEGTKQAIGSVVSSITNTKTLEELNAIESKIDTQFSNYSAHPEFGSIPFASAKSIDIFKELASSKTEVNKRRAVINAVNSGLTSAEVETSAVTYSVVNAATLMYPEDKSIQNSTARISSGDMNTIYTHMNTQADALFTSGDPTQAFYANNKFKNMSGSVSSNLDTRMALAETQGQMVVTNISQVSAYKEMTQKRYDMGLIPQNQYTTAMMGYDVLIRTADANGNITPKSKQAQADSFRNKRAYHWDDDIGNQKIRQSVQSYPWIGSAKVSSQALSDTQQMLITSGKMKMSDSSEAQGELIAKNLVYGMNKTLLPKLNGIEENQLSVGMELGIKAYAKKVGKNISTKPDDIEIILNGGRNAYLVKYKESNGQYATEGIQLTTKTIIGYYDLYQRGGGTVQGVTNIGGKNIQQKSTTSGSSSGRRR
jgi:hypothetical protein